MMFMSQAGEYELSFRCVALLYVLFFAQQFSRLPFHISRLTPPASGQALTTHDKCLKY
jgi:hypothetical protein